jgi:hypothetical protein
MEKCIKLHQKPNNLVSHHIIKKITKDIRDIGE